MNLYRIIKLFYNLDFKSLSNIKSSLVIAVFDEKINKYMYKKL